MLTYIYVTVSEKMSHPGQRRIPDDDEEIELTGTRIEMAEDSDIAPEHSMREDAGLLRNVRVKRRSCIHNTCRIVMGIVATAVFTFMLIQLWSNYGDTIKQRVFSPQVVGAGCFDEEGEHGKLFGMQFHKWINNTLHINMTKPENDLIQVEASGDWSYEWDEDCLQIVLDAVDHVTVMVWSIY